MLHLRLLGPPAVLDADGLDITPPGARERLGLATLAVVSPDGLSTERIADELYREGNASDPRNAVQAMVSRLRRALGRAAGSVQTTTTGYRLVDLTVDIDEAERLLNEAMANRDPMEAQRLLRQATDLWRGPTMDGLSGDLVDGERLRIDNLRADAEDAVFERRVDGVEGIDGGPGIGDSSLLTELETAVRDQPLREKRWELLMVALYRGGRQADALRAFQRARTLLSDRLGLQPGPGLADLEQRILAHDPGLRPPNRDTGSPAMQENRTDHATTGIMTATVATGGLPSGTVSLLLCDVEGSVRQWESSPEDTAREIEQLHQIWADAADTVGGQVVKSTGDGVLAAFETARAAVTAAVAAAAEQNRLSLMVRVAINTGSLTPVDHDYRGPVINRCARLLDLANGGQILISGTTAELFRAELPTGGRSEERSPDGISVRDLGTHWLRDVPEPLQVWQVNGPGIRANFPPLQSHGPRLLPRPRGELLGRRQLTERIVSAAQENPLTTLLGPGGIGKTSLALSVAWELAGTRPVTFVDLARVSDPATVEAAMLDAVTTSDHDEDQDPVQRITERLRHNTDLVVIDNAEHVLDAVASVVDQVMQSEIKGSVIVTSRQPLGLADETIIGIPPLEVPADGDDLDLTGQAPSVRLFVDRAKAVRPDFEVPNGLLPVVAHICRRLDGIPLAIELAAGRTSLLSLDDIAARLDDQLRLLRQVRGNRDRRHQSLEAVVSWSIDQLSRPSRDLFVRLSVMAGSFGIAAVEGLLEHDGLGTVDALDALDELQQASLLRVEPEGSRFRMLEPIRQVAEAELDQRDLLLETRRAHVQWITSVATDAHRRRDNTRAEALSRLDDESAQLVAAVVWATDGGQVDLLPKLALNSSWWFLTREARLGERLFQQMMPLIDRAGEPLGWAEVYMSYAIVTAASPTFQTSTETFDAVQVFDEHDHADRDLARVAAAFSAAVLPGDGDRAQLLAEADALIDHGDEWGRALLDMASMTLLSLSEQVPEGPELEDLLAKVRAAVASFRRLGETWVLGATLGELGRLYLTVGNVTEAEACLQESLELFADADFHGSHYALTELGQLASERADHQLASQYHADAMKVAEADGNLDCIAMTLAGMGHAAEHRGEPTLAVEFYQRALATATMSPLWALKTEEWQRTVARLQDADSGPSAPDQSPIVD